MNRINIPTSEPYTIELVNTTHDVEILVDNRLFAVLSDKKVNQLNIHSIRHWVEKEHKIKKDVFESNNYQAPYLVDIEDAWMSN